MHLAPLLYIALLFCLANTKRLKLSVLLYLYLYYSICTTCLLYLVVYSICTCLSVTSAWIALLQASSYRISMTYHCADVWVHTITRYRYTASDFLIKLIFIAMLCYCFAMLWVWLCYRYAIAMLAMLCYAIAIAIYLVHTKLFTWCKNEAEMSRGPARVGGDFLFMIIDWSYIYYF